MLMRLNGSYDELAIISTLKGKIMKILNFYFSATGNTDKVAKQI